ncbi:MAG: hypothetical protein RLZ94_838, partial [Actinomycetota bacterium]
MQATFHQARRRPVRRSSAWTAGAALAAT